MRTRRGTTLEQLRQAIDGLPRHTREAMLEGIAANPIIVGAYATSDGICPMLAAHRNGGRTAAIAFAEAWDGMAFSGMSRRARRAARSRRATRRELLILRAHLEASLLAEDPLAAAEPASPSSARTRPARTRPARTRPGDPNRAPELAGRSGWAWSRVVRRLDDYERVLRHVEEARREAELASAPR